MKFMEKIYRAFCADEVKLMLDHMEDNLADFQSYDNKWHDIAGSDHFTKTERKAIKLTYTRLKKIQKRQELLAQILSQKLNPESKGTPRTTMSALHSQALAGQQAQYNQLLSQKMQQQYELALHNYNPAQQRK